MDRYCCLWQQQRAANDHLVRIKPKFTDVIAPAGRTKQTRPMVRVKNQRVAGDVAHGEGLHVRIVEEFRRVRDFADLHVLAVLRVGKWSVKFDHRLLDCRCIERVISTLPLNPCAVANRIVNGRRSKADGVYVIRPLAASNASAPAGGGVAVISSAAPRPGFCGSPGASA